MLINRNKMIIIIIGSDSVDIGAYVDMDVLDASTVSQIVKLGHIKVPAVTNIPKDAVNHSFPASLLSYKWVYFKLVTMVKFNEIAHAKENFNF